MHIAPDGSQQLYLGATKDLPGLLAPNGFALDRDGSFLVAHLADDSGGVFRLSRSGTLQPVLREVDGEALRATNFVLLDSFGRLWITVSTRQSPRSRSFRAGVDDGYIVLLDRKHARIVADGLGFANEVRLDRTGSWLYVNETYSRRLTRFRVAESGDLRHREVFATFGPGTFPDGLAFDSTGALLVTSIISNRVIRITPDGRQSVLLEDSDPTHLDWVEAAYRSGQLGRDHIARSPATTLKSLTSLAFGSVDLRTAYLGVLLGDRLPCIQLDVPGEPMVHWNWR
jgi:hypothetical protein